MSAKLKRRHPVRLFSKLWLPAVALVMIAIISYGVNKVRHSSDISYPPSTSSIPATVVQINPKNVTYEVFGDLGVGGKVVYADLRSNPVEVRLTSLPWCWAIRWTNVAVDTKQPADQLWSGRVPVRKRRA